MSSRRESFVTGLILILLVVKTGSAAEPPEKPASGTASPKLTDLLRIGEMAQAAADLRKAGESLERFGNLLGGMVETVAGSLAAMSSEFDPFGYKTAFRTLGQQTEIIQEQSETIRELQDREIERLQRENQTLKKQLDQLGRQPKRRRAARQR